MDSIFRETRDLSGRYGGANSAALGVLRIVPRICDKHCLTLPYRRRRHPAHRSCARCLILSMCRSGLVGLADTASSISAPTGAGIRNPHRSGLPGPWTQTQHALRFGTGRAEVPDDASCSDTQTASPSTNTVSPELDATNEKRMREPIGDAFTSDRDESLRSVRCRRETGGHASLAPDSPLAEIPVVTPAMVTGLMPAFIKLIQVLVQLVWRRPE